MSLGDEVRTPLPLPFPHYIKKNMEASCMDIKDDLDLIQRLMTQTFIDKLQSGDVTPSELNTIRQFLRDNNIVITPEKSAQLGTLGGLLPEFGSAMGGAATHMNGGDKDPDDPKDTFN